MMLNIALTSYDIGTPPMYKNVGGFPHISVAEYQKILDYLQSQNITTFNLIGGEPTIHADFDEILKLTNKYSNQNPEAKINLYTNGYNLYNYISLLGLNINIVLQWLEDENKTDSTIDKEILKTLQILHDLNYFALKRAILEIPVGVIQQDYSFVLSLIKQYDIKMVQIKFIPLYAGYDNEQSYNNLKNNFLDLCEKLPCKIIINPLDCLPWCCYSKKDKDFLKSKHINYPIVDKTNIILYGQDKANTHLMDNFSYSYLNTDIKQLNMYPEFEDYYLNCKECNNYKKKKCFGRGGRKV